MSLDAGPGAVVAAVATVLLLPAIPQHILLAALLTLRVVSDIGSASAGSVLPASALSGGVAVVAIAAALLPSGPRLPRRGRNVIAIFGVVVSSAAAMAVASGLPVGDTALALIRWLSFGALAVLAWRVAHGEKTLWVFVTPVTVAVLGVVAGLADISVLTQPGGRIAGTFSHANAAGAYLGAALVFEVGLLIRAFSGRRLVLAAATVGAILATQSLGALAAAVVASGALVLISVELRPVQRVLTVAASGLAAVMAFWLGNPVSRLSEFADTDIEGAIASRSSTNSLEWRFVNWDLYWVEIRDRPWFGHGLGSARAFEPLGAPPHSLYIETLYEFGFAGALLFALMIIGVLGALRKSAPLAFHPVLALLLFVAVNGWASNILGYTAAMMSIVCSAVWWSARSAARDTPPREMSIRRVR